MREVFSGYDPNLSFYAGFKLLWYNYLKAGLIAPARNLFIDQYQRSDILDEQSVAIRDATYEPLYAFFEAAKAEQIIKDIPVEVIVAYLIGGANEVGKYYLGKSEKINTKVIDQCFEMAWNSIRK